MTGLGYTSASDSPRARALAFVVRPILRLLLRRKATITLLENEDDRQFIVERIGVPAEQTAVNKSFGFNSVTTRRCRYLMTRR